MDARSVQFPANLNDFDLDPQMTEAPKPRLGVTDVRWPAPRRYPRDDALVHGRFQRGCDALFSDPIYRHILCRACPSEASVLE